MIPSNSESFFTKIIENRNKHPENTIIDSIVMICDENNIDIEDIIHLVDDNIKEHIRVCAIKERKIKGRLEHKLF